MRQSRAITARMFACVLTGLLVAAALMPFSQAPAEAASENLTVSGRLVADPSAGHFVEHSTFSVALTRSGDTSPIIWAEFRSPDFSITAPEPGLYTLKIDPSPSQPPSPWAGTWFGDTPFPWQAEEILVDGLTPVTDLVIKVTEAGSVSGSITAPLDDITFGHNYGLSAHAFLLDPATGMYEYISGASRDYNGPYTVDNLPPGTYVIRFGHSGSGSLEVELGKSRAFPSAYFPGTRYLEEAQPVEVSSNEVVAGIDGVLSSWSFDVARTAGADRYETSVRISEGAFKSGVPAVYLASGAAWADALSAAPAAAHNGGPLLLTAPDYVPPAVLAELARLQPGEIVIAGGPAVVSNAVLHSLSARGYSVRRVAGNDRYDTSRKLAVDAFAGMRDRGVWLATGRGFADALSSASNASRYDIPLILVDGAAPTADVATVHTLTELGATHFLIAGGPAAIGQSYFASLQHHFSIGAPTRFAGADRYETSRIVAEHFGGGVYSVRTGRAFLASGTGYADALSAAPVAGLTRSPLLLTPGNCVPSASLSTLVAIDAFQLEIVGGPAAMGAGVENLSPC